jgi:cytidylate kinase
MSSITITDGVFGCGEILAKRVSAVLGYRYLGHEALMKAVQRYRLPEAMSTNVLEVEPPWWKRLLENRRVYRIALQAAMCDIAEGGNFVCHGRASQELVPAIRHILKILLIVPNEYRMEQVRQAKGLAGEAAQGWVAKMDEVSDRRIKSIFGVGWRDPSRYDLVLNVSKLSFEKAACLIVKTMEQVEYQVTGESEREFHNFILEAKVRAALMASANTCRINVKVQVNSGLVHLSSFLHPVEFDFRDEIIHITAGVPGVKKVTADIQLLPINDDSFALIQEK